MSEKSLTLGVIGADHNHIYSMLAGMVAAGARCKGWWTRDKPDMTTTKDPFPGLPRATDYRRLLDDPEIDMILIAAMPGERPKLAIEAMRAGKDVMVDKPAATNLEDLAAIRQVVAETGCIWSVNYSERYQKRAMVKAGEMIKQGAIGRVVQTLGMGPHRLRAQFRPAWFFEPETSGGVLGDIIAHQMDHFLFFTGSTTAEIVACTIGNYAHPEHPRFEDFGEVLLRSDQGHGYGRVDWYVPDDQPHVGDSRLTILGTEGHIEIRKYVDVAGRPGGDHLLWSHGAKGEYVDCTDVKLVYFEALTNDVRARTETASTQEHSFMGTELALRAQKDAVRVGYLARR